MQCGPVVIMAPLRPAGAQGSRPIHREEATTRSSPVVSQPQVDADSFTSTNDVAGPKLDDPQLQRAPAQREVFSNENPWPVNIDGVPTLNARYTTPASRAKTVAVLGASSDNVNITEAISMAATLARTVVERGGNIVSGAGIAGVMGAAFFAARDAARAEGAGENLTLIKTPPWGDEDFSGGRAIGQAPSEEQRVEQFVQVAATVVAFPGGAGTALELIKLANMFAYPAKGQVLPERVVVVGGDAQWAGLKQMFESMVGLGLTRSRTIERFVWANDLQSALAALPGSAPRDDSK